MIPIEVKPFYDETISSWIIRNSIANGSDPTSWAAGIWPDWRLWTRDIDRSFPIEKAYELSKITSLSLEEVKGMTLEPHVCKIEGLETLNLNSKWKWVIPTGERGSTKVNGMHFCPKCLSEPIPYLKKQWRLSWNTICHTHECQLLLHCPECNGAFTPNKIDYENVDFTLCTHCGSDLKKASASMVDIEMIKIQEEINNLVFEEAIVGFPFKFKAKTVSEFFISFRMFVLFFRRLHHFESHQRMVLDRLGISAEDGLYIYSKGEYFDSLSVEERMATLYQAICFLQLPLKEMIDTLVSADISQQMLKGEMIYHTNFTNEILDNLEDRSRHYSKRTGAHDIIRPKSKEEVMKKMAELKAFI